MIRFDYENEGKGGGGIVIYVPENCLMQTTQSLIQTTHKLKCVLILNT